MPLLLLGAPLILESLAGAQVKQVKRVLVFNEQGLTSPTAFLVDQEIRAAAEKDTRYQIELYSEYLETGLFPDAASQQEFRDWYIRKYRDRRPDVIITAGPSPLNFLLESHDRFFSNIPVVFGVSTEQDVGNPKLDSDFTGTWIHLEPAKTLEVALKLKPGTKHVVVVGGAAVSDRRLEAAVKTGLRDYEGRLEFTYLTDLDMPTLLERLRRLPPKTIVFYTQIWQDAAGKHFVSADQALPLVLGAANAPVFVVADTLVGSGAVGGYVNSFTEQGKVTAEMAMKILNGAKPQGIPIVRGTNVYMFDWRALRRWGLKESAVPPGSVVLYRQPGLWESYEWYILGGIFLILAEGLLIFVLLWERSGRIKAKNELVIAYDRLRLAVDAARAVGWDWDVRSGENRWFGDMQTMFGIPLVTYSEYAEDFRRRIYPEDWPLVWKTIADARESRKPYIMDFRVIREDGTMRWITARGKFYYASNSKAERMLGMAADITDRKAAEEAIAGFSGRLIKAQEEERQRIAREIHDDYQQRLAVLAIDLETLAENIVQTRDKASQRLRELWNQVSELGGDMHDLSHRLHSSTLASLGLVAGVGAFCNEFAGQQGMSVDFAYENVPRAISPDVALCLFRIVQEGLRNVKRHSGASRAEVRLEGVENKLHLAVSDQGRGFDLNPRSARRGIGIQSMEERLRHLGGHLEIDSQPSEGTRIDAWLTLEVRQPMG